MRCIWCGFRIPNHNKYAPGKGYTRRYRGKITKSYYCKHCERIFDYGNIKSKYDKPKSQKRKEAYVNG